MNSLVIIKDPDSAPALMRWAARFTKAYEDSLMVLCWFDDQQVTPVLSIDELPASKNEPLLKKAMEIIGELKDLDVELLVVHHPSPAKTIIEMVERKNVRMLLVGLDSEESQEVPENQLARRLLRYAPCDFFVLDPGDGDGTEHRRILMPLGQRFDISLFQSMVELASKMESTIIPLEMGSNIGPQSSLDSKLKKMDVEYASSVQPTIKLTGSKWRGITSKSRDCDLVVFSASSTFGLQKMRTEERRQAGPKRKRVSIGMVRSKSLTSRQQGFSFFNWTMKWLPRLKHEERIDLFDRLRTGARWNIDFIMMIGLSTAIASLGLMQNSTAVVIGAMVVAPLMTPLIGAGLALVQHNLLFFRDSIRAMSFGVVVAFIISMCFGFIVPLEELTTELVARGAPTILDLGVAFLSGSAAAYAMARPSLLGALAGVAIAAALVPPLATVGIALTHANWNIAKGAAILLTTNLLAIILGAAFIYRCLGIQGAWLGVRRWVRNTIALLIVLAMVLIAPLGYELASQLREGQTRPYTLPVSQALREAIIKRVHLENGITFISASRFGIESNIDIVVLLSSEKPVSAEFISDLKKVIVDTLEESTNVSVQIFQEAKVERSPN